MPQLKKKRPAKRNIDLLNLFWDATEHLLWLNYFVERPKMKTTDEREMNERREYGSHWIQLEWADFLFASFFFSSSSPLLSSLLYLVAETIDRSSLLMSRYFLSQPWLIGLNCPFAWGRGVYSFAHRLTVYVHVIRSSSFARIDKKKSSEALHLNATARRKTAASAYKEETKTKKKEREIEWEEEKSWNEAQINVNTDRRMRIDEAQAKGSYP